MHHRLRTLSAAALFVGALVAACSSGGGAGGTAAKTGAAAKTAATPAAGKIVIAVLPTNTPDQLQADAKGLERFLAQRMNRPVEIIFPTTYAGVIEALRFGHAQAAFMSAWPLALAEKRANATIALAEVREVVIGEQKTEAPYYYSYWVVRPDSPYRKLEDLRGKRAAFPSTLSTSGYVAPMGRMVELGLLPATGQTEPKHFFGEVAMAGGYAQGWEALKAGQVDVTVIAGDVPEKLYREVLAGSRVIEQQGPVPSHGVAFAKSLDPETRQALTDALMALNAPEQRDLMRKFISGIFVRFEPTTGEKHLAGLNNFLRLTNLEFVERLR